MIARILIWNLFDSKTTLEELREHLPALPEGDVWIANEAQDRFGLISFDEQLPGPRRDPGADRQRARGRRRVRRRVSRTE